ncbi:hypothetical protein Nepgr_018851 [Nepenthes gracilis]|uniref:Uncharacterized protein n=1 Tax=Nepenthes gracilis TaxID=150966 RepID=A0AAD3XUN4_NEPGR|nr:hypothetical protein Nepgr_018851 [Nepenthes gracilis]
MYLELPTKSVFKNVQCEVVQQQGTNHESDSANSSDDKHEDECSTIPRVNLLKLDLDDESNSEISIDDSYNRHSFFAPCANTFTALDSNLDLETREDNDTLLDSHEKEDSYDDEDGRWSPFGFEYEKDDPNNSLVYPYCKDDCGDCLMNGGCLWVIPFATYIRSREGSSSTRSFSCSRITMAYVFQLVDKNHLKDPCFGLIP